MTEKSSKESRNSYHLITQRDNIQARTRAQARTHDMCVDPRRNMSSAGAICYKICKIYGLLTKLVRSRWLDNFFLSTCDFFLIYFTKTTLFTPLTLQNSIYSTLLNIIYCTLLKSLKYLHCFYLLIYLFIYLSTYYVFMNNKQTDKKQNKYQN